MKIISILLFLVSISLISVSQPLDLNKDTLNSIVPFEKNIYHSTGNSVSKHFIPIGTPHAQTSSGRIQLYFEDVADNLNYGFDDPGNGQYYRDIAVCAYEYIESVIDLSSIDPLTDPIKIYFESSDLTTANPYPDQPSFPNGQSSGLAFANILYDENFINTSSLPVQFSGGFLYDHIINGTNPTAVNYQYDGIIAVNLQSFPFTTSCTNVVPICTYDLFSVILHETTHLLGFASSVVCTQQLLSSEVYPYSPDYAISSCINSNRFSKYDELFLYSYSVSLGFTKLVSSGGINSIFTGINEISNNSFWIFNNAFNGIDKTNLPIYSGNKYSGGSNLHHLDNSYRCRTYQSPQFVPDYIMCPAGKPERHYLYTLQEISVLQGMGYTINPTFNIIINNTPQQRILNDLNNIPPRTTAAVINPSSNPALDYNSNFSYLLLTNTPPGYNTTLQNNTGSQLTIDLTNPSLYYFTDDNSGDQISVYPGSLVNIRGCGNGGNNHACLSMPDNQHIIFTPRNNFVGRAQFGFNLYDGIEMGAFVVITINVTYGSAVNNGSELVLNGTVEEGTEVKTLSDENKPDNYIGYMSSAKYPDCTNYSSIYLIRDSYRYCFELPCHYGYGPNTVIMYGGYSDWIFGATYPCGEPESNPPYPNDRYLHLNNSYNFYLSQPLQCGYTYNLSIDMAIDHLAPGQNATPDFYFKYGFGNNISTTNLTEAPFIDQSTPNYDTWLPFNTSFVYNGPANNNVLSFQLSPHPLTEWYDSYLLDNISLLLVSTIPTVVDAGSDVTISAGQTTTLNATPSFTNTVYSWSNGGNTASIQVSPVVTTTYTVSVTICGVTLTDNVTVNVMLDNINSENNFNKDNIKIYPNPVQHTLFIEPEDLNFSYSFELLNSTGQALLKKEEKGKAEIDISGYTEGLYFLKFTGMNHMEVYKFSIVNRVIH